MRKFKFGLIALVASAAVAIPAGSAVATSATTASPAGVTKYNPLIDIDVDVKDVANNNHVFIGSILSPTFSQICVLNDLEVATATLLSGGEVICSNSANYHVRKKGGW